MFISQTKLLKYFYPPASEASREVENFDWRKKHTPTHILGQNFVTLSVCHGIRPKLSQDWQNKDIDIMFYLFIPLRAKRVGR